MFCTAALRCVAFNSFSCSLESLGHCDVPGLRSLGPLSPLATRHQRLLWTGADCDASALPSIHGRRAQIALADERSHWSTRGHAPPHSARVWPGGRMERAALHCRIGFNLHCRMGLMDAERKDESNRIAH